MSRLFPSENPEIRAIYVFADDISRWRTRPLRAESTTTNVSRSLRGLRLKVELSVVLGAYSVSLDQAVRQRDQLALAAVAAAAPERFDEIVYRELSALDARISVPLVEGWTG